MPKEVQRVPQLVLKRDHVFIDTVGVCSVETPVKIQHYCLIAPHESHFPILCHYLKRHLSEVPDYKVGMTPDQRQYIHRLGRTGREGKVGEGILLLAPWEQHFLDEVKNLLIEKLPAPSLDPQIKLKVDASLEKIDTGVEATYHAWLGYYNSIREISRDKTTLVELVNRFSGSIGPKAPSALFRKTAIKMGSKDIPGIRVHN